MIKPLTSLRFFFALFVFVSHLDFLGNYNLTANLFKKVFQEGFLGVSFFFILSGFILNLTYKTKLLEKSITLKEFFVARFARIYPMHIISMLIAIPASLSVFGKVIPYHLFLLQSFVPRKEVYFSLNAPSWSISDEMFFYALFPLLIFIIHKANPVTKISILILMTVTILILNFTLLEKNQHYWLYVSPLIRIFDFILGMLLFEFCLCVKKNIYRLKPNFFILDILSICTFVLFFVLHDHIPISFRYSIYYWIPMVLIIFSASQQYISKNEKGFFHYLLSNRVLVYLGEISFCFYMLHILVMIYGQGLFKYLNIEISPVITALIFFVFSIIASAMAYEKIEKPLNKKIKTILR